MLGQKKVVYDKPKYKYGGASRIHEHGENSQR